MLAAANLAGASRLQSLYPVRGVAELASLGRGHEKRPWRIYNFLFVSLAKMFVIAAEEQRSRRRYENIRGPFQFVTRLTLFQPGRPTRVRTCMKILASILLLALSLSGRAQTRTWTGADPSGYWSAPANWSPAGVLVNGDALVFPGGLPPGDKVSTNNLTDRIFRSISLAGGHTIRGNPITLTNRTECIINSGT